MYAILKSREWKKRALVSVAVSALTTGFDKDVDPINRKQAPDFYG